MTDNRVKVSLRYPAYCTDLPDKATGWALARETKTLWIVDAVDVTITHNPGNVRFGEPTKRFRKKTHRQQGRSPMSAGWRCSAFKDEQ